MINLHAVGLQLHSKETPAQVLSCDFCEISKITLVPEHLQKTALDYISINSSEEELANKTVSYDTEINSFMTEVRIIHKPVLLMRTNLNQK